MENVTKALSLAASVLIGVILLGMLVFGYSQISEGRHLEQKTEREKQLSKLNINFFEIS